MRVWHSIHSTLRTGAAPTDLKHIAWHAYRRGQVRHPAEKLMFADAANTRS